MNDQRVFADPAQDWRRSTPVFLANLTRRSRARCISLASVGKAAAFGCTVAPVLGLDLRIALEKSAGLAAPARVSDKRSKVSLCGKTSSPRNSWS